MHFDWFFLLLFRSCSVLFQFESLVCGNLKFDSVFFFRLLVFSSLDNWNVICTTTTFFHCDFWQIRMYKMVNMRFKFLRFFFWTDMIYWEKWTFWLFSKWDISFYEMVKWIFVHEIACFFVADEFRKPSFSLCFIGIGFFRNEFCWIDIFRIHLIPIFDSIS